MKKIITLGLFALVVVAYSCSPKTAKTTAAVDTAKYTAFVNQFDEQALISGKTIMEQKCVGCHDLVPPEKHSLGAWDNILRKMIPKAELSAEHGDKVRAYIYSVVLAK